MDNIWKTDGKNMDPIRHHYVKLTDSDEFECYTNRVLGYRYHWHNEMFEFCLVLSGSMHFCRDGKVYYLQQDDILIVNPGEGHASFSLEPNTIELIIHIPSRAFRRFMEKGQSCDFNIVTNAQNRNENRFREFRYISAKTALSTVSKSTTAATMQAGSYELLLAHVFDCFDPIVRQAPAAAKPELEKMLPIIRHVEQHYQEKVTLEDLANTFGYNRTYLSSAFKKNVGIGLYEYMTKIRFQHAVHELCSTEKTLTSIAIDNGFPELKTFNKLFFENFQLMPGEYRKIAQEEMRSLALGERSLIAMDDPAVLAQFSKYTSF